MPKTNIVCIALYILNYTIVKSTCIWLIRVYRVRINLLSNLISVLFHWTHKIKLEAPLKYQKICSVFGAIQGNSLFSYWVDQMQVN